MTDKRKIEIIWMYVLRKADDLLYDYKNMHNNYTMKLCDELEYLDLITAKVRLDLFEELERDIINIIGDRYHPKEKRYPTSQKK